MNLRARLAAIEKRVCDPREAAIRLHRRLMDAEPDVDSMAQTVHRYHLALGIDDPKEARAIAQRVVDASRERRRYRSHRAALMGK